MDCHGQMKKGTLEITKQVLVKFQLGKFHDEVLCDVIPMKACHLLLGRSWIIEREAIFDKKSNKFCVNLRSQEYFFCTIVYTFEGERKELRIAKIDKKKHKV